VGRKKALEGEKKDAAEFVGGPQTCRRKKGRGRTRSGFSEPGENFGCQKKSDERQPREAGEHPQKTTPKSQKVAIKKSERAEERSQATEVSMLV